MTRFFPKTGLDYARPSHATALLSNQRMIMITVAAARHRQRTSLTISASLSSQSDLREISTSLPRPVGVHHKAILPPFIKRMAHVLLMPNPPAPFFTSLKNASCSRLHISQQPQLLCNQLLLDKSSTDYSCGRLLFEPTLPHTAEYFPG